MASRRDQLHSYQFMTQRVISAFVMRETDPAQSPLRRGIGALFGGLMIAILIAAAFGIYGILTKVGTDQWKSDGSVVVERQSGASFVYLQGRLNPALNFASAKLAAGKPNPVVYRVAAKSLADVPRGVTIGIPGAPASLPDASHQVGLPWTMCVVTGADPKSVLVLAGTGPATTGLGERGLLVNDAGLGMKYLVWHGLKHLVQDSQTTVPALFGAIQPTPVSTAWLNALPAGADIAAPFVGRRGQSSAAVPDHKNGEVLDAKTGSGDQYYLVLDDGFAAITPLQAAVLTSRYKVDPIPFNIGLAAQTPSKQKLTPADPATAAPDRAPALATANAGDPICAATTSAAAVPVIRFGGSAAGFAGAVPTRGATSGASALADAVLVPAGTFEIVRVPGSGGYAVVTDLGLRFAVPTGDALGLLGYSATSAVTVPTALVSRLPAGVTLDPAAATQPAPNAN